MICILHIMQYQNSSKELVQFPISSEDVELLINIKTHQTVEALSKSYKRDISVISRKLTNLSKTHPVLIKENHRWRLTTYGEKVVQWAQDSIRTLQQSIHAKDKIKIASTREFA